MDRITRTFQGLRRKKEKAFIPFVVIGDPDYKVSLEIVRVLSGHADMLELGFSFSDPIADGKTIQAADVRAAKSGVTTQGNFQFIKSVRKFTKIPIGLLVYANLIYQRGIEKFYRDAADAGVDSVLVADVPLEESKPFANAAKKFGVKTVFTISPLTDNARAKEIAGKVSGFLYGVSVLGVTGARKSISPSTLSFIRRIKKAVNVPVCVGFGISDKRQVQEICHAGADGAIVGSAIVRLIEQNIYNQKVMLKRIKSFAGKLKQGTKYHDN
ncbi:tryptophan synthase subunit alpha [Candidatus Woesearchaeota archaeon]|nr:tryptophan synthase subunit alpha [Candidatus Woesearchaeota archaeon]